ncbi:DEAD/DEAH box helicase [Persicitalea jodogahamensis]|uniref:Helicase n=1 Tax=Persicitalea jodogahamensis TaxID=402147 RepID=A0A8J3D0J0_9BACT|nr:DEAD/DEAH box helicase [Persicitalea jodogahamensis]GHB51940.1 helicase [Persicitalea jodogahamensis]
MAKRIKYGQTWWGQQWISVLEGMDQSGRLARGRTYANGGAVQSIDFEGNTVKGKVRGTRPIPYKVKFRIEPLSASDKAKTISLITDNPLFLTQLLNRQLPADLYEACRSIGVDLFPESWNEFDAACTCPDWSVPCKHQAAVLYLVANEIDKNPFLIFELRDFDLFKALEGLGLASAEQKDVEILDVSALRKPAELGEEIEFRPDEGLYDVVDFSKLPDCRDDLLSLLADAPLFYKSGNFKIVLRDAYIDAQKKAHALAIADASDDDRTPPESEERKHDYDKDLDAVESGEIICDEAMGFLQANFRDVNERLVQQFNEVGKLLEWLQHFPVSQLPQLSPLLRGLYLTNRFTNKLLETGGVLPQLLRVQLKKEAYFVRWVPALLNEDIAQVAEHLKRLLPPDFLFYKIGRNDIYEPLESEWFPLLCSLLLTERMRQFNDRYHYKDTEVEDMFFRREFIRFSGFDSREIPANIQLWLNKFFIAQRDFVPVIQVEDDHDTGTFVVHILVENKEQSMTAPIAFTDFMEQPDYAPVRMGVLRDLSMMAEHFPQLNTLISSKGLEELAFSARQFPEVLFKMLPPLKLFGIRIMLPKSLRKLARPQLSMTLDDEENGRVSASSVISLEEMLGFRWEVAIGDQHVDTREFVNIVEKYRGLVKIKDQYVYLDENEIRSLLDKLKNPPELDSQTLLQTALTEEYQGSGVKLTDAARKLIKNLTGPEAVNLPKQLDATLRPYQVRGYEWLYKNARIGFGSLIADDMGLGKTLQVIAALQKFKEEGAFKKNKGLVILPTTLLTNWSKEIARFAPGLRAHVYHGPNRSKLGFKDTDLVLTTYGVVRSEEDTFTKTNWPVVVIDEAQNIKNPATAQTKAVKKIKAGVRIAMSGTPVENRLSEYWSIIDFANKGYLGSLKKFSQDFSIPIEVDRDQHRLDVFRRITEPFILRRVKTDKSIIQDLPDKIEMDQSCQLSGEQAALYQSVVDTALRGIEGAKDGFKRSGMIFKMMTALKQICNHPTHYLKKGGTDPAASGKSALLLDLVQQLLENGEKALIFTQYEEMGILLQTMFEEQLDLEVPFLHGAVSRKNRDEMVEDFQTNRATRLLLLSLKAGGTGLNLTAANNVIHYDLWWNPAVEAQATDRAFRIGQTRNVLVHRLITEGTFEEKINQLIQNKKELANLTVANGETWIGEYSNADLKELVALK